MSKETLGQTNFLGQKDFRVKKMGVQIKWVQKIVGPKKCWVKKNLGQKKIYGFEKKICVKTKFLGLKYWKQQMFGTENIFGPKQIFESKLCCMISSLISY